MPRCICTDYTDGSKSMSVDGVCMQQLLYAGKSNKRRAPADQPTRLLRQLLFSDSDCQVVRLVGSAIYGVV